MAVAFGVVGAVGLAVLRRSAPPAPPVLSSLCASFRTPQFTRAPPLSHDLQKQRDEFALAMRVRLGKDGFQLIACHLP